MTDCCDGYIYAHLNKDGEVFYIGMGGFSKGEPQKSFQRAYHTKYRSLHHKRKLKKHGLKVEILASGLHRSECMWQEVLAILYFNTFKDPTKCNYTAGGDGAKGKWTIEQIERVWTIERRIKHSIITSGEKNGMYGKSRSEASRKQQSTSVFGSKNRFFGKQHTLKTKNTISKIQLERFSHEEERNRSSISRGGKLFCVKTKEAVVIWKGVSKVKCSKDLGLLTTCIRKCLKGERKTHKGYTYEYL